MIDGYIQINRNDTVRDPEVTLTASGRALLDGKIGRL
jgi:hypothetical protein